MLVISLANATTRDTYYMDNLGIQMHPLISVIGHECAQDVVLLIVSI